MPKESLSLAALASGGSQIGLPTVVFYLVPIFLRKMLCAAQGEVPGQPEALFRENPASQRSPPPRETLGLRSLPTIIP